MNIRPAALIIKNKKILLLKYNYNGNIVYNIPGGNHENNEAMADTLSREMIEELNIKIVVEDLILVTEATRQNKTEKVLHLIFECKITENEPVINKNETSAEEVVWLPTEEINKVNLYPNIGNQILSRIETNNPKIYLGTINQPWY